MARPPHHQPQTEWQTLSQLLMSCLWQSPFPIAVRLSFILQASAYARVACAERPRARNNARRVRIGLSGMVCRLGLIDKRGGGDEQFQTVDAPRVDRHGARGPGDWRVAKTRR